MSVPLLLCLWDCTQNFPGDKATLGKSEQVQFCHPLGVLSVCVEILYMFSALMHLSTLEALWHQC
jgi:hypothetical protein